MEYRVDINGTRQIIEVAQLFEARTNTKPILAAKQEVMSKLVNLEIETNGVPQTVLNFYGYDVIVFPNDSNLGKDIIYAYTNEQIRIAVLNYLNDKCQNILKEMQKWISKEMEE